MPEKTPDTGSESQCAYGCGFTPSFYVGPPTLPGIDAPGTYCCARHLAFYVRSWQSQHPASWLSVCELTHE